MTATRAQDSPAGGPATPPTETMVPPIDLDPQLLGHLEGDRRELARYRAHLQAPGQAAEPDNAWSRFWRTLLGRR